MFFSGPASKLPIVCMWVLGIVTVLPHNYRGVFGYDCRVGYCTMIRTDDKVSREIIDSLFKVATKVETGYSMNPEIG